MFKKKEYIEQLDQELEENPNATLIVLHYSAWSSVYFKIFGEYPEEIRTEYQYKNVKIIRTFDLLIEEFIVL